MVFKFISKCQKEILTCCRPFSHVCDFSFFHQMIAHKWLQKLFFISSKKSFSFSRYSIFYISFSPLFPVGHWFRGWSKVNPKVCDVINFLNKNLIPHFLWYLGREPMYAIKTLAIDRVLNKEHFYEKIMQKMCTKSWSQTTFLFWWITLTIACKKLF